MARRKGPYLALEELKQNSFWRKAMEGIPSNVAVYAYCVLSGMNRDDAIALVWNGEPSPQIIQRLVRSYERQAQPLYAASFVAHGLSRNWAAAIIREVGDDKKQPGDVRLAAAQAALRVLGEATVSRETVYHEGNPERTVIREEISRSIQENFGALLHIPRETDQEEVKQVETVELRIPREE